MTALVIGEMLKSTGVISEEQIEAALHVQKVTKEAIGEIFVRLNFITDDELARAVALQNDLEYVDLDSYIPDKEVLKLIDKDFAMFNMVLPLKIENDFLIVVTAWPNDGEILEYLEQNSEHPIRFAVSDSKAIARYVQFYYEQLDYSIESQVNDLIELSTQHKEIDIKNFVDLIINNAIKDRVTDIHITPEHLTSHIFYRIDGVLKHCYSIPTSLFEHVVLRIKVLSQLDIAQHLLPQDGEFDFDFLQSNYNIRVSTIPTINGEKLALRLMPENFRLYTLENLGFDSDLSDYISQNLRKTSGIILLVGSSGSGKTTTLYAMLRKIDILKRNVICVEEPVEYHLPFINQIQVNTNSKYTFDKALHHIARQDPDVIAIGEILDDVTAKLAIRSSATGHLILSTFSASSSVSAISRLNDFGVDKNLLADGLLTIVSQKLLRKLCDECKEELIIPKDELLKHFGDLHEIILSLPNDNIKIYKENGCKHCRESGYIGRTAVVELLHVDEQVRDMIEYGNSATEIEHYINKTSNTGIKNDALKKVLNGITSLEEVERLI